MQTLHIQGPYEDRLADAIALLLIGSDDRLVVQTEPGMGVVYMTRNILERLGREVIDLRVNMMDDGDTADYIEQNVKGFKDDAVLLINDCSLDLYNRLKGVREYTQRHKARGGKTIIVASY